MRKQRIILLDLLRILAITLVIIGHVFFAGEFIGIKGFYYVTLAGSGVTVFIILSGMVIDYNYSKIKYNLKNYFNFLYKRSKRIYIPYWIAVAMTLVITGKSLLDYKNTAFLDLTNTLVFTGISWYKMILPAGWFLGVILVLYVLYPAFKYLFSKFNINLVILFLFIFEVISRLLVGRYFTNVYRPLDWVIFCRVFEFGLGIWLVRNSFIKEKIESFKIDSITANRTIVYLAELSFPIYLIHWTVLYWPLIQNSNRLVFLAEFAFVTVCFALAIMYLDRLINKVITKKQLAIQ